MKKKSSLIFLYFEDEELDDDSEDDIWNLPFLDKLEEGDDGSLLLIAVVDLDLLRPLDKNSNAANAAMVPAIVANMNIWSAILSLCIDGCQN